MRVKKLRLRETLYCIEYGRGFTIVSMLKTRCRNCIQMEEQKFTGFKYLPNRGQQNNHENDKQLNKNGKKNCKGQMPHFYILFNPFSNDLVKCIFPTRQGVAKSAYRVYITVIWQMDFFSFLLICI